MQNICYFKVRNIGSWDGGIADGILYWACARPWVPPPEPLTEERKAKCKKLEVLNFIMMNFKHTEIWKLLCSQQCLTICHIYLCEALNVSPDIISYSNVFPGSRNRHFLPSATQLSYISNNHSWTLWFSGHSQLSLAIKGKQSRLLAWLKLKSFHSLRSIFSLLQSPWTASSNSLAAVAVTSVAWDSWKVVRLGTEHSVLSICCSPRVLAFLRTHYFPEVLWILCREMIGRGENPGAGLCFVMWLLTGQHRTYHGAPIV